LKTNKIKTGQTLAGRRRALQLETAGNFQAVAEKACTLSSTELAVDQGTRVARRSAIQTAEQVKKDRRARFPDSKQPF